MDGSPAAALRQRAALKRVGRWLFQDDVLGGASCLHATASQEAEAIRRLPYRRPVAVVPWGVPPAPGRGVDGGMTHEGRERTLLYLGRLHPTKGLEMLLGAWAQIRSHASGWRLVIAGNDEGGYKARLTALACRISNGPSPSSAGGTAGPAAGLRRM